MSQRPSFDVSKLSTPDKILGGGALLLFIDSFLSWQKVCVTFAGLSACGKANAWSGNGGFLGTLMALAALLLVVGLALTLAGVAMPQGVPVPTVMAGLTGATVLFGLIKFLIAVTKHGAFGAYLGLILILVVAYGGYMKMQEGKAASPPSGGMT
jgi:hypothetical protein